MTNGSIGSECWQSEKAYREKRNVKGKIFLENKVSRDHTENIEDKGSSFRVGDEKCAFQLS